MTIFHLRDLANNARTRISCDDIKVYQAPQYKGLKIEDMLQFAAAYPDVAAALPEEPREILKLHRDYVSTIIYTLVGRPFHTWVQQKIKERNETLEERQDMTV